MSIFVKDAQLYKNKCVNVEKILGTRTLLIALKKHTIANMD
jgi:hypothetical protein